MSEWLSYGLSDFLLFSPATYYRLFELYNLAVWPAQLAALALGLALLWLLARPTEGRRRLAAFLLAGCWLWVAVAYHAQRYATINWAADWFAAAFALQAALLLWLGLRPRPRPAARAVRQAGLALFVFALLLQPLLGPLLGRDWRQAELFGLAPDPTVAATLGALLALGPPRWLALPIPLLWCAVSGATLWAMAAPDALLLPLAGAAALLLAAFERRLRE